MRRAIVLTLLASTVVAAGCTTEVATPEHVSSTSAALSTTPISYALTVDWIDILHRRSTENDTDFATVSAAVNGVAAPSTAQAFGNLQGGTYAEDVPSSVVTSYNATDTINFGYIIANSGYAGSGEQELDTVLNEISSVAAGIASALYPDGSLWSAVNTATQAINGLFTSDCDGIVATDLVTYDAASLAELTAATGSYGETRIYPGTNSATFCGSNSLYQVHYTITRQAPTEHVETFWGADGRETTTIGDWQVNSFKSECGAGEAVKGLSVSTTSTASHDALCRTGTTATAAFPHVDASCHAINFANGDSRRTSSTGDWDPSFHKGECGTEEYVAGIAQSTTGQVDALLCCAGAERHVSCSPLTFDGADVRETLDTGDWDYGYYKAECGDDRYVAGVSRNPTTGAPHTVLCCGF